MTEINISTEHVSFMTELNHSETARKFINCLPISKKATKWGGELYFEVSFHVALDNSPQEEVHIGRLA